MNFHAAAMFLLLAGAVQNVFADDAVPPPDPQLAALQAQVARLTARATIAEKESALLQARFGAPATAPAGTVAGAENFGAFAQWALVKVYDDVGTRAQRLLAQAAPSCPKGYLVTSTGDRAAQLIAAGMISMKLDNLRGELDALLQQGPHAAAIMTGIAALAGLVGTADKLVGLFRSDYSLANAGATPDDLAVRTAIAGAIGGAGVDVIVDGLDQRPTAGDLLDQYDDFYRSLESARKRYAAALATAKTDERKAELAEAKVLLDAAAAFENALTTSEGGSVPLVGAAVVYESIGRCVVHADFSGFSTTLITRKRLLSRNDNLVAISGGTVVLSLHDAQGKLRKSDRLTIDRRVTGRLTDFVDTATAIRTPEAQ